MRPEPVDSLDLLERLIAFPTVSASSNMGLMAFVQDILHQHGIDAVLDRNAGGDKANLFATVGPRDRPGIVLSGHTDVVPMEGQAWTTDPFRLTERDGNLYGRGSADMKGFVACALRAMVLASRRTLAAPLHLALSYDEEIGCVGVRSLLDKLKADGFEARLCIVGEPTGLAVALGHKGKLAARATCVGLEGHSAMAPNALNALHLAADFIAALRQRQDRLARDGARDPAYDVPYTTIHAGVMRGGTALNIVPNRATIDFEIRNIAADNAPDLFGEITQAAMAIVAPHRDRFPTASISVEVLNAYPGLETPSDCDAATFVRNLLDRKDTTKVAYGTEAGFFQQRLGIASVVCGPGFMIQGHGPDEFVSHEQLSACDRFMDHLLDTIASDIG